GGVGVGRGAGDGRGVVHHGGRIRGAGRVVPHRDRLAADLRVVAGQQVGDQGAQLVVAVRQRDLVEEAVVRAVGRVGRRDVGPRPVGHGGDPVLAVVPELHPHRRGGRIRIGRPAVQVDAAVGGQGGRVQRADRVRRQRRGGCQGGRHQQREQQGEHGRRGGSGTAARPAGRAAEGRTVPVGGRGVGAGPRGGEHVLVLVH